MERYTLDGRVSASGLGSEKEAFKRLLFNLCKSGCTIPKIHVIPGGLLGSTTILYTVEGTAAELAIFRKEVEGW